MGSKFGRKFSFLRFFCALARWNFSKKKVRKNLLFFWKMCDFLSFFSVFDEFCVFFKKMRFFSLFSDFGQFSSKTTLFEQFSGFFGIFLNFFGIFKNAHTWALKNSVYTRSLHGAPKKSLFLSQKFRKSSALRRTKPYTLGALIFWEISA